MIYEKQNLYLKHELLHKIQITTLKIAEKNLVFKILIIEIIEIEIIIMDTEFITYEKANIKYIF